MDKQNTSSGGISFFGLLAIVFITLKLCKVITWSWVWVLMPIWIWFAIGAVALVAYIVYAIYQAKKSKRKMEEIRANLKLRRGA